MNDISIGIAVLLCVIASIAGAAICGFICFKQGIKYRKKTAEAAMGICRKGSGKNN